MAKTKFLPCPYCADPALLDPPKGKGGLEVPVVPDDWRIWRDRAPLLDARAHGARYVADVPARHLAERFAGLRARIVGVHVGGRVTHAGPPMFDYAIFGATDSVDEGLNLFSAWVVEGPGVEVRAHWWPGHETIINQRATLTARDAADRNAQLNAACAVLDFFALETRGTQKITEADVRAAVRREGRRATQRAVARRLGISEQGLAKWRKRRNLESWEDAVEKYAG
jgi:hypothetical protein